MTTSHRPHPWTQSLHTCLDGLETALLANDAMAVERHSAQVQSVLQQAPRLDGASRALSTEVETAAQRFIRLRQAVLQANARSQRALESLLPQTAPATYGARVGSTGQNYHLSA